jgi:hypothetical protein
MFIRDDKTEVQIKLWTNQGQHKISEYLVLKYVRLHYDFKT